VAQLCQEMDAKGQEMGLSIRVQREDIFEAMHRV
jgi:predicted amino acid-binding ACT domain protein